MDTLNSILVGVDFTACSSAALKQAIRIAARNNATLKAVHVIDTFVVVDLEEALSDFQQDIQKSLLQDARRAWENFEPHLPGKNDLPFDIAIGNPADAILKHVERNKSDLLVLGVHGANFGADGAGELAASCVRRSPSKVLLVREPHDGPFKSVVVGVDFSDTSFHALEAAARLASRDAAALHVAHVFQAPSQRVPYFTPSGNASLRFQSEEACRENLTRRLETFCAGLGSDFKTLKHQFHVVQHSSDGRGISEFAKKQAADVLVIGTRGRTNLSDVLLGSTAERVLRQAPCSILTVRAR